MMYNFNFLGVGYNIKLLQNLETLHILRKSEEDRRSNSTKKYSNMCAFHDYFVKPDLETAVDRQTRFCDQTPILSGLLSSQIKVYSN